MAHLGTEPCYADGMNEEVILNGSGRTAVFRRGDTVFRGAGPWSATVISLLQHLEGVGFQKAPRVIGSGFDEQGRETVSFVDGEFVHPHPWSDGAMHTLGQMLKELHEATATFVFPHDAVWRSWFGRSIDADSRIVGHCDTGPWNIVSRSAQPIALIDWEVAGPVSRNVELAQACWLNAQLVDDDIAERMNLGSSRDRAKQVSTLLDGYGLTKAERSGFFSKIVSFAIHDAAQQAVQAQVTPDSHDVEPLWAITWRTRSASWMLRKRSDLEMIIR